MRLDAHPAEILRGYRMSNLSAVRYGWGGLRLEATSPNTAAGDDGELAAASIIQCMDDGGGDCGWTRPSNAAAGDVCNLAAASIIQCVAAVRWG